ncbi:MAG: hypothetical protein ACI3VP_05190, partial [Oscillospiraceae bacterium]
MQIKEYIMYHEDEILHLYASTGSALLNAVLDRFSHVRQIVLAMATPKKPLRFIGHWACGKCPRPAARLSENLISGCISE